MAQEIGKMEVIGEIVSLYDRIAELEADSSSSFIEKLCKGKGDNDMMDDYFMKVGRKSVFDDSLGYWQSVDVAREADGSLYVQSFEDWRKHAVIRIPDVFSKVNFYKSFDKELRELYEEKKDEAVERFEKYGKKGADVEED